MLSKIFPVGNWRRTRAADPILFRGRFELRVQSLVALEALHQFLSEFDVLGYQKERLSVFDIPAGAEVQFKPDNKKHENKFVVRFSPAFASQRQFWYFEVSSEDNLIAKHIKCFARAFEDAILENPQAINFSSRI